MQNKYNKTIDDVWEKLMKIEKAINILIEHSNVPTNDEVAKIKDEASKQMDRFYEEAMARRNYKPNRDETKLRTSTVNM